MEYLEEVPSRVAEAEEIKRIRTVRDGGCLKARTQ